MGAELYNAYQEKIVWTKEQEACLRYTGGKPLMVKGIAGAGKSLVIQALAKQLLAGYSADKRNKVAIFTFSGTLNAVTKDFLKINEEQEEFMTVMTLNAYAAKVYREIAEPMLKIYPEPSYTNLRKQVIKQALEVHESMYGHHRFQNLDLKFWLDEIDWMKDMNVAAEDMEYYLSLPRKGRGGRVRMSEADREVAFQIFQLYDELMKERNAADWADWFQYIIRHRDEIPDELKFDHVLIDEAQDLSLIQMFMVMTLFRKDMVAAMDVNQRIFNKQWTPKMLGIDMTTKRLTKSMRTTRQIDDLAESVRKHNDELLSDEEKTVRAIPEKEGTRPVLVHLQDAAAEKKFVTEQIKAWLKQNSRISIGVIAAKTEQVKLYASWMTDAGISPEIISKDSTFSMAAPGVKIVNAYNTKGLEFARVIIPQFLDGNFPYRYYSDDEEEMRQFMAMSRNLLYVAMTRAQYSLVLTYEGNQGSRFIGEMDPAYYDVRGIAVSYAGSAKTAQAERRRQVVLPPTSRRPSSQTGSSGFVKWHGEKEECFEDMLQFARQREAAGNKKTDVPTKTEGLRSDEVLGLILKEKRALDVWYAGFLAGTKHGIETEAANGFYRDLWLYSVNGLFGQMQIGKDQQCRIMDLVLNAVLKVDSQVTAQEYLEWMQTDQEYMLYIERGFTLKSRQCALFWQWIGHLAEHSGKMQEAERFVNVYFQLRMHLLQYLERMVPSMKLGEDPERQNRIDEETAKKALRMRTEKNILRDGMKNPIV